MFDMQTGCEEWKNNIKERKKINERLSKKILKAMTGICTKIIKKANSFRLKKKKTVLMRRLT